MLGTPVLVGRQVPHPPTLRAESQVLRTPRCVASIGSGGHLRRRTRQHLASTSQVSRFSSRGDGATASGTVWLLLPGTVHPMTTISGLRRMAVLVAAATLVGVTACDDVPAQDPTTQPTTQ